MPGSFTLGRRLAPPAWDLPGSPHIRVLLPRGAQAYPSATGVAEGALTKREGYTTTAC